MRGRGALHDPARRSLGVMGEGTYQVVEGGHRATWPQGRGESADVKSRLETLTGV